MQVLTSNQCFTLEVTQFHEVLYTFLKTDIKTLLPLKTEVPELEDRSIKLICVVRQTQHYKKYVYKKIDSKQKVYVYCNSTYYVLYSQSRLPYQAENLNI